MPIRMPYYQITVEGEDISAWIDSVSVIEDDRQADSFSATISDPRIIYTDALFEGSTAEIDLGYAGPNQHALMLRATITKVELNYPQNGVPVLTIKGEDKSILMGLEEKNRVWRDRTITDIVREIGQSHGFNTIEAQLSPDPTISSRPLHQDGKTDLAFLQELAHTYHAKCFVELDERGSEILYFIPERRIVRLKRPEQLFLYFRTGSNSNLISFSPRFDSSYIDRLKQVHDVDQQGQPIQTQERLPTEEFIWSLDPATLAQASPADERKIRSLYDRGAVLKRELQERLTARRPAVGEVAADQAELDSTNDALESRRLGMSASGSTFGNIWLRAKANVTIEGVGERFKGNWYVSSVTHKIDSSGFKTDFRCVR